MTPEIRRSDDAVRRRPGPKPSVDVDRIVAAAVHLADTEGLAALSMRRLATELGVAAMTLYGHVPGRSELVELMQDAVLAELYPDGAPSGKWRARLDAVARANWTLVLDHPWTRHLSPAPSVGPNHLRKYEVELRAVDGLGLSEVQMDLLVSLVNGFVRGVAGRRGGQWRAATAEHAERFPTVARVASAVPDDEPERSFEFGLERLLDGIGVLILDASR
jgi:AcrR family transcriptional regulator